MPPDKGLSDRDKVMRDLVKTYDEKKKVKRKEPEEEWNRFLQQAKKWTVLVVASLVLLWALIFGIRHVLYTIPGRIVAQQTRRVLKVMGQKMQRKVSLGRISVSIFSGVGFRGRDLWIANRVGFSNRPFVEVGEVRVTLKLIPLVLGRVDIKRIELYDTSVLLERNKQGAYNYADLLDMAQRHDRSAEEVRLVKAGFSPMLPPGELLSIPRLVLMDGAITFEDNYWHGPDNPVLIEITNINATVHDISRQTEIQLDVTAGVNASSSETIKISGSLGPLKYENFPFSLTMNVDECDIGPVAYYIAPFVPLSFDDTRGALSYTVEGRYAHDAFGTGFLTLKNTALVGPELKRKRFDVNLTGGVAVNLKNGTLTLEETEVSLEKTRFAVNAAVKDFNRDATAEFSVTSPAWYLSDILPLDAFEDGVSGSIRLIDFKTELSYRGDEKMLAIDQVTFVAGQGMFEGSGQVDLTTKIPQYQIGCTINKMKAEEAIGLYLGSVSIIQGRLSSKVFLSGSLYPFRETISGGGNVTIDYGGIPSVNLINGIFNNLPEKGMISVLREIPELIGCDAESTTEFNHFSFDMNIADERIHTDNLQISSNEMEMSGEGYFSFDKAASFSGSILLTPDVSSRILQKIDLKREEFRKGLISYIDEKEGELAQLQEKLDQAEAEMHRVAEAYGMEFSEAGLELAIKKAERDGSPEALDFVKKTRAMQEARKMLAKVRARLEHARQRVEKAYQEVDEFKKSLCNEEGRILIPFIMEGDVFMPHIEPDIQKTPNLEIESR